MIKKALFVGAMGLITVMAALGLGSLRDSSTPTAATTVIPIQPFAPDWSGSGTSSTVLSNTAGGAPAIISNRTEGVIPRGTRIAIPYIYSSAEWYQLLSLDAGTIGDPGTFPPPTYIPPTGTVVGSVIATLDVKCTMDVGGIGVPDVGDSFLAYKNGAVVTAYPWVLGQVAPQLATPSDTWLNAWLPPFPWLLRDTAHANHFIVSGASAGADVTLNTVFSAVPFSPNGGVDVATTRNGGNPEVWTQAANGICIDTPQNSTSFTSTSYAPPALGYTAAAGSCTAGTCADAAVYGPMVKNDQAFTVGGSGNVSITSNYVNRGPTDPAGFTAHWEVIATNPNVADAHWVATGNPKTLNSSVSLAAAATVPDTQTLAISCAAAVNGEALIIVKNALWPGAGISDYYPSDNANVNTIKVVCGTDLANLSDLTVDLLRPNAVSAPNPSTPALTSVPEQINLQTIGQSATVTIREINTNNDTNPVTADQYFDVESSGAVTASLGTVTLSHGESGGTPGACAGAAPGAVCTDIAGVSEPVGMSDLTIPVTVTCPADEAAVGRHFVVVTGILAPDPRGESTHGQKTNAQRVSIMVNCWSDDHPMPAPVADKDDGNGLYVRWTIAQSNPDDQASFASPPSFPSDQGSDSKLQQPIGGYTERIIQVGCYFMAVNGCFKEAVHGTTPDCDTDAQGYYTPADTREDYRYALLGAVDTVQCMEAAAVDTPGHPVALPALGSPTSCGTPQYVYTGAPAGPMQASQTFNTNQD
ncbi:MAG: hypothetical protein ABSG55_04005, partial [Dehalococcoidia bacterium]